VSKTFKFASSFEIRAGAIIWNLISLAIVFFAGWKYSLIGALYAILICGPFFWVVQIYAIANTLDVVVDGEGIRRCFGGKTWLSIKWINVKHIQRTTRILAPYNGGKSISLTYINIWPINKPRIRLSPSGKLSFSSQMAGFDEFIELVSQNAKKYRLTIE
jgi:hypothetical protein